MQKNREGEKIIEGEKREVVGHAGGVGGGGKVKAQGGRFVYGGNKVSKEVTVDMGEGEKNHKKGGLNCVFENFFLTF